MEDIVLQYTYPGLDTTATIFSRRRLKAPFCVHPKTSRIWVPVDPRTVDDFDSDDVPTVGQLLVELNNAGKDSGSEDGACRFGLFSFRFPTTDIGGRVEEDITCAVCPDAGGAFSCYHSDQTRGQVGEE